MSTALIEHFERLAASAGGVAKLRELILSLAVRGKLVHQDPADEPASELLKKVAAEKDRLIVQKLVRKSKPLPTIEEHEQTFELPHRWEWVRLGEIGDWGAGATPPRGNAAYYGGAMPWFKSGELTADFISKSEETVTEAALRDCSLRANKAGDVLVAMYGATIGKTSILSVPATTNQAVCACTPYSGLKNRYLLLLIKSLKPYFISQGAGGAQPNISREKIIAAVVGLPPTSEQSRIVAKVEELMALCDRLEAEQDHAARVRGHWVESALAQLAESADADEFARHWQHLAEHFDTLFTTPESIDRLDATLLQLAVRGKLVHQDPADEPASELLKKIRAEKDRLIAEGKIKRDKALPPISDDEKPYELPEGWEWVRIGDAVEVLDSLRRPVTKEARKPGPYPYYGASTIVDYVSEYLFDEPLVLVGEDGAKWSIGENTAFQIEGKTWVNNHAHVLRPIRSAIQDGYLCKALNAMDLSPFITGTTVPKLNQARLNSIPIPLPPLSEQSRIVAKVEELMALTASLKARLAAAQTKQAQLAEALIADALAC